MVVNTFKNQLKLWCHKSEPLKQHVIGSLHQHSLNERIVISYYLLPPVNHHQLADLFSITITMTVCYWPIKIQKQIQYYSGQWLKYRRSETNSLRLHIFECKYFGFYTVYELEIYLYSFSLLACKALTKSNMAKIGREGLEGILQKSPLS